MPDAVTRERYWATCDSMSRAMLLESEKAALGPEILAAWWRVAEPRWRELSAVLDAAEAEDWARAAVWFDLWREARRVGAQPGAVDVREAAYPAPGSAGEAAGVRGEVLRIGPREAPSAGEPPGSTISGGGAIETRQGALALGLRGWLGPQH